MGVPLSPDQMTCRLFPRGVTLGGCWLTSPPKKILLSTIVDMEPSLIWIFDGHCKQGRCLRRIASSSSSTKKNHQKKTQNKIVLMLNSDTFRLKNSGSPTRDSPVLKKSEQNQFFPHAKKIFEQTHGCWLMCLFLWLPKKEGGCLHVADPQQHLTQHTRVLT